MIHFFRVFCFALLLSPPVCAQIEEKVMIEEAKEPTADESRQFWKTKIRFIGNEKAGGFENPDGSIRIPPIYEKMPRILSSFMIVKLNGQFGVIDNQNKVLIPFGKYSIIERYEGYALKRDEVTWEETALNQAEIGLAVKKDNKWGLVNPIDQVLIPIEYDRLQPLGKQHYAVNEGMKWKVVTNRNQAVSTERYDKITAMYGDMYKVQLGAKEGLYKAPDTLLLKPEYDNIKSGSWPYLDVQVDTIVFQYHTYDRTLTRSDKKAAKLFSESSLGRDSACLNYRRVSRSGALGYGVTHITRGTIVLPIYDWVGANANCTCFLPSGLKRGVVDTLGQVILPFEYQALNASEVNPNLLYGGKTNEYSFFNTQGKPVSGETYSQITPLNNGFFSVKKDKNNYAVVNPDGKRVSDFLFTSMLAADRRKGTVKAMQDGKSVCLDAEGKVVSCE